MDEEKKLGNIGTDRNNLLQMSSNTSDVSQLPLRNIAKAPAHDRDSQHLQSILSSKNIIKDPLKRIPPLGHRDVPDLILSDPIEDSTKDSRFAKGNQLVPSKKSRELVLEVDDLDIPWGDLVLRERIGSGIFLSFLSNMYIFNRIDYSDYIPWS